MTIKYPDKFRQMKAFDWDFLKEAFANTNIEPMDIDGLVERNGNIIIFESKSPNTDIPRGQALALERLLIAGRGKIFLLIIYGDSKDNIIGCEKWRYSLKNSRVYKEIITHCDSNYVFLVVRNWFQWANYGDN